MPEITRFSGIIIRMYFDEHPPPHFHAIYGKQEAQICIAPLQLLHGNLPPRVLAEVLKWASEHQQELKEYWLQFNP